MEKVKLQEYYIMREREENELKKIVKSIRKERERENIDQWREQKNREMEKREYERKNREMEEIGWENFMMPQLFSS